MTEGAASVAYPGSRTLAEWWRQIKPFEPRTFWIAHVLLYRVEALVQRRQPCCLDRLALLLLQALAFKRGQALDELAARTHLGLQLSGQILRRLADDGLVASKSGGWAISPLGEAAARLGEYSKATSERREFYFTENGAGYPPHYLCLRSGLAIPCPPPDGWSFDIEHLRQCIAQPNDWKLRYGFPPDIVGIVDAAKPDTRRPVGVEGASADLNEPRVVSPDAAAWPGIAVVHSESITLLLALSSDANGERLLGFDVQQKGWELRSQEPILMLRAGWRDALPRLASAAAAKRWRHALRVWAQANGFTAPEAEGCPIQHVDFRLKVTLSRPLFVRLRASRNEALRSDVWLLAGDERVRQAALLQLNLAP